VGTLYDNSLGDAKPFGAIELAHCKRCFQCCLVLPKFGLSQFDSADAASGFASVNLHFNDA
jgi:hypothetical protein